MGSGRFDYSTYTATASTYVGKDTADVFKSHGMHKDLDPRGVLVRESRDSADNPNSTPLIVGLDVTGSMGMIADAIAREGLGVLFKEVLDRKPISDPHLMFMGIGDVYSDYAPLQVSQFEADNRILDQLTNIYLEHGGGANDSESYNLPWYFAAMHTSTDAFEKRAKKGYLFTVGDECYPPDLQSRDIDKVFGNVVQEVPDNTSLLQMAGRMYHIFHIIVEQGSHVRHHGLDHVRGTWLPHLGQNALVLKDHTKLSEVVVSTIQVLEGASVDTVAKSWSGDTSLVVREALKGLTLVGDGTPGRPTGARRL